jgi:Kef-type K+ transport system membrane component KefB
VTLSTVSTLVLIGMAAVLSPILAELSGKLSVPDVVFEIGLGIVIGPAVLNIAHPDSVITALSDMGLSYLMFLAGYELDLARVRGRSLRLAGIGWAMSLGLALLTALALVTIGTVLDAVIVGLALTTTALGTLLPILRDANLLEGRFGSRIMAIGSVGEFGPILAVAILLDHRNPAQTGLLLLAFVAVAVSAAVMAARPYPPKVIALMHRHLQSSAQLPIRVSVLLVIALVYLAYRLGLDVLLGAFAAGIVVRLLVRGEDSPIVKGKLEAIGYGLLIPIFFIVSGMEFHLTALTSRPIELLRVPLFLVLFLIIRGTPAFLLYRGDLDKSELPPLALLSATGLPLIVVITTIGIDEGRMLPVNAAALVFAGMMSVLLYPMAARALLARARAAPTVAGEAVAGAANGASALESGNPQPSVGAELESGNPLPPARADHHIKEAQQPPAGDGATRPAREASNPWPTDGLAHPETSS